MSFTQQSFEERNTVASWKRRSASLSVHLFKNLSTLKLLNHKRTPNHRSNDKYKNICHIYKNQSFSSITVNQKCKEM